MRFALVLVAGCAAQSARPVEPVVELAPPIATFRWALAPVACHENGRSTIDTCEQNLSLRESELVAVYTPTDDTSMLAVIRYDGHLGAPLRWQQNLTIGPSPHSAVVTVVRHAAIVAAISNGAARVVAIDNIRGRVLGTATIVGEGARSVQLEVINDYARIHVRTATGGVVAVMHPRTARVITQRTIDERSIFEHQIGMPDSVEAIGDVSLQWETGRLVVRRGAAWKKYVRMVHLPEEQSLHRATLQRAGDRMLVTVHDVERNRIEVLALDHATGAEQWRSTLTSNPRRVANVLVHTAIDADQLIVAGETDPDRFACTIGIADGVERACVERFEPTRPANLLDEIIELETAEARGEP